MDIVGKAKENASLSKGPVVVQGDAKAIRPEALEIVKASLASGDIKHKGQTKRKEYLVQLQR